MRHVTIHCKDLEESVAFYRDICGLKIQAELIGKGPHDIVFLGDEKDGTQVEVLEDLEHPYGGEGISMGFEVDDVAAYHEKLENEGYNPTPLIQPNPEVTFFFIKDPNGVEIQFI